MKTVDLVYEKHVVRFQRHQYAGQVARLVKDGSGCGLEAHVQFVCYDVGKGGLAQSRRAVQQGMVEAVAAHPRRLHEHAQVLHDVGLSAEIIETERPQRPLYVLFHLSLIHI